MVRRHVVLSGGIAVALAVAVSCQEATQVTIEARTNVIYRDGITTAFTVGATGQTESADPTTESVEAWSASGLIGTLSVVPATSDDAALSIKLVMGVTSGTRTCVPPLYRGCIVARRTLRYVPGQATRLPITLYAECVDVPCDEGSTCNALRQCVPAAVDQSSCEASSCRLPGETEPGGPDASSDAAVADAGADGAPTDSGVGGEDASESDSGDGGSSGGTPGAVACGSKLCIAPEFCCTFSEAPPACMSDKTACLVASGAHNLCDGREDCGGKACCGLNGTSCGGDTCTPYPEICDSNGVCSSGKTCGDRDGGFVKIYRRCE